MFVFKAVDRLRFLKSCVFCPHKLREREVFKRGIGERKEGREGGGKNLYMSFVCKRIEFSKVV